MLSIVRMLLICIIIYLKSFPRYNFLNFGYLSSRHYIYMSEDVMIRDHLSSQKGPASGKFCETLAKPILLCPLAWTGILLLLIGLLTANTVAIVRSREILHGKFWMHLQFLLCPLSCYIFTVNSRHNWRLNRKAHSAGHVRVSWANRQAVDRLK